MPQITVTIDDDVYWDLQNLPKGLKSRFVCLALRHVISWKCDNDPAAMHAWARNKPHTAFSPTEKEQQEAKMHPDQTTLTSDPKPTALEQWANMQKELHE